MLSEISDHILVNNSELKRKIMETVSDAQALRDAMSKNRYSPTTATATYRPNLFKARDAALLKRFETCRPSEPWLKDLISKWSIMSGLPEIQADFWQHKMFMSSIKNGGSLVMRRYLDDDGWGWISVYDSPTTWVHKRRLPESTTRYLAKKKADKANIIKK